MTHTGTIEMTKRSGGRPRKSEGDMETSHVRVYADIKEMVTWLAEFQGKTQAQILDPIVRDQVITLYSKIEDRVEKIKKQRAAEAREMEAGRKEFEGQE